MKKLILIIDYKITNLNRKIYKLFFVCSKKGNIKVHYYLISLFQCIFNKL